MAVIAAIVVTAVVVTVATAGTGTIAMAAAFGAISGGAQMVSNAANDQPLMKNVTGAFVGGFISGATGGVGQVFSGFVNAGINELENEFFYDDDNEMFSVDEFLFEGLAYTGANYVGRMFQGSRFFPQIVSLVDTATFTASDVFKEKVLDDFLPNAYRRIVFD